MSDPNIDGNSENNAADAAGQADIGTNPASRRTKVSIIKLLVACIISAIAVVTVVGWADLYTTYLEKNSPRIILVDKPSGIGTLPCSTVFDLIDAESGLDEVVVRTRQRGSPPRELLRRKLNGKNSARVTIDFAGEKSNLDEGQVDIEIRAFDRSLWNNTTSIALSLPVDYRKPRIEPLTTQLNGQKGGSQVFFYQAIDEDLAESGIMIGSHKFLGYPARGLDRDLTDRSLHVVFFALPLDFEPDSQGARLFAVDRVGNSADTPVRLRVFDRSRREAQIKVSESFLRSLVVPLAEDYRSRDDAFIGETPWESPAGSNDRLIEQFGYVMKRGQPKDDQHLRELLKIVRFEGLWKENFNLPFGTLNYSAGDRLSWRLDGQEILNSIASGYEYLPSHGDLGVHASNDGIVLFSESIGTYGRTIGIDHGLGISSVYARLEKSLVKPGELVTKGQRIAEMGTSGLARSNQLYFEIRVQGHPVSALEWAERKWYSEHVIGKLIEVKRILGLEQLVPLYR